MTHDEKLKAIQALKVDRTLLSADQLKALDAWTEFFHGPIWKELVERYTPVIDVLQSRYHTVQGEQQLGHVQGALKTLYAIFLHLPDQVNAEFLQATGQLQEIVGEGSHDDPVIMDRWQV